MIDAKTKATIFEGYETVYEPDALDWMAMMRHRIADWRDMDAYAIQHDIIHNRGKGVEMWSWSGMYPRIGDDVGNLSHIPNSIISAVRDYLYRTGRLNPDGDIVEIIRDRKIEEDYKKNIKSVSPNEVAATASRICTRIKKTLDRLPD